MVTAGKLRTPGIQGHDAHGAGHIDTQRTAKKKAVSHAGWRIEKHPDAGRDQRSTGHDPEFSSTPGGRCAVRKIADQRVGKQIPEPRCKQNRADGGETQPQRLGVVAWNDDLQRDEGRREGKGEGPVGREHAEGRAIVAVGGHEGGTVRMVGNS